MERRKWKSSFRRFLRSAAAVVLAACMLPVPVQAAGSTSSDNGDGTFTNPVIYSDVPDLDVIRVEDNYYMVSTTMHLSPGMPIMKSKDLVNWEIVNYCYDILDDSDELSLRNGKEAYGDGSWAASIKYHDGKFYVSASSQTTGKTYVFSTTDIENGVWKKSVLDGYNHDLSLLFDDQEDGTHIYMFTGSGSVHVRELQEDAEGNVTYKDGGLDKTIIENANYGEDINLKAEGAHAYKINGKYYIFMIQWPNGGQRQEICWRSDSLTEGWKSKVVLDTGIEVDGQMDSAGVAQGGIVETADGDWYAPLFQDHGAVGRIPMLAKVTWENDWPVFSIDSTMDMPVSGQEEKSIVVSDEFYNGEKKAPYLNKESDDEENAEAAAARTADASALSAQDAVADAPETREATELIVNGGFENGTDGWELRAFNKPAKMEVTSDDKASGESSLFVYDKEDTTSGPMQDLTGKVQQGQKLHISAKVKYETGPATRAFNVTMQYGTNNFAGTSPAASATLTKGEWGTIEADYTVPSDADLSRVLVFVETTWTPAQDTEDDLMDFYLDDVSIIAEEYVDPDEIIINGGFENGTENWKTKDPGMITAVTEEHASGNTSAKITDRTATASGPMQDITGKIQQGQLVQVSAKVKYNDGPVNKTFNICIQNGDWSGIKVAASATAKKGEWTTIEGKYTIPNDADMSSSSIFIETAYSASPDEENDLFDFYVDDISLKKLANPDTVQAGENDYNGSNLKLEWQWNHNPNNKFWSLTERDGYLRLTTANKATGLLDARNTLTQRTYGPTCSGDIAIETANMKNGDVAGLAALQANYGYVGVKMENGKKSIVMVNADGGEAQEIENIPIDQDRVYLRADFNFYQHADDADFYYSLDGTKWKKIGNTLNMSYTIPHFMGYRFAIFNYATQATGGYVDVDYFHVNDGADTEQTNLKVNMDDVQDVQGIINTELEVPLYIDGLPEGTADSMEVSINIPSILDVADVEFNGENVRGTSSWTFANHQLKLSVTGEDTGYADNSGDRLFATLKLKLNNYVAENTTVTLRVDYVTAEGANAAFSVGNATANVSIVKPENNAVAKLLGNSNPLIDYDYGADPFALVYDGRVYLYMTADKLQYEDGKVIDNDYSYINKLHVISSDDMVNWTDHGFIQVAGPNGVAKWANFSWAPAVACKQIDGVDKFFLYFCNSGGGIGVLEGDSPVGPWRDPNKKALIDGSTQGVQGVPWIFDPAVMVDDDGTGYLVFGGGVPAGQDLNPKSARIVKLADNMTSLANDPDGVPQMIDAPCMFEDGGIHKANGKYYYSYCSNFSGNHSEIEGYPGYGIICYMVSDDPMGPYTYGGEILQNPSYYFNVGGNNHHALFEFNGTTYITYHAQTLGKALGIEKGYRSTHINEVEYYEDGSIKPIDADMEGVSQLKAFSPYSEVAGTTIGWNFGIAPRDLGGNNMVLSSVNNGDWVAIGGVDFGENGAETFEAEIAGLAGGTIELCLDSPDGEVIGTLDVKSGNGDEFTTLSCSVENAVGEHTLFFVYSGEGKDELMEVQSWQFTEKEPQQDVDKTVLKAAIDRATAINASEYTTASLTKMYEALETAKEVYGNDKADQTAVNDAAKALNDARGALVRVSDKSELQNLIAKVNGLKESDYTKESWNALQQALAAAVKIDANHDASQTDVDNAAAALQKAIDALEAVPGSGAGTGSGDQDGDKTNEGSGNQDENKAVQTGDDSKTAVWGTLALAGAAAAAAACGWKRKRRKV